jgi:hypothetical protein
VADALLNGRAIRIEGGNFEMALRRFRCGRGHEWDAPEEASAAAFPVLCPSCNGPAVLPIFPARVGWRRGGRRAMRRRHGSEQEEQQTTGQTHEEVQR